MARIFESALLSTKIKHHEYMPAILRNLPQRPADILKATARQQSF
jgi:hypothetical protein